MDDYRTNVGLAAVAFALAAVAGFAYGARADFVVLGPLLLGIAVAWGVQWAAAGRPSGSGDSSSVDTRTKLARASWIAGFALALVLIVAAIAAS